MMLQNTWLCFWSVRNIFIVDRTELDYTVYKNSVISSRFPVNLRCLSITIPARLTLLRASADACRFFPACHFFIAARNITTTTLNVLFRSPASRVWRVHLTIPLSRSAPSGAFWFSSIFIYQDTALVWSTASCFPRCKIITLTESSMVLTAVWVCWWETKVAIPSLFAFSSTLVYVHPTLFIQVTTVCIVAATNFGVASFHDIGALF